MSVTNGAGAAAAESVSEALCADCGNDTTPSKRGHRNAGRHEWYMVHDDVWVSAGMERPSESGGGFLCIGCLEERLGRTLTPADFIDGSSIHPWDTPRLKSRKTGLATHIADSPPPAKNTPVSLGNTAPAEAKPGVSEPGAKPDPCRKLEWQQVNAVTWRLVDPDAPEIRIEASHGQWGGYHYPKALAYVFDVGVNDHDWRVRVRKRGGWLAFGSVIDADLAKRLAQAAVEGDPYRNEPPDVPLNLLGGHRWPDKRADNRTIAKVIHAEVGGELAASSDIVPPSDDSESLNVCAPDWLLKLLPSDDWPDSETESEP